MIRISEAHLVKFGKFVDYKLDFSRGLQVIYGKNEAGKSTIQLFLKVMLYGIYGAKKDSKGLKIRERIVPWNEKNAVGILRLEVDEKMIEIRRKFGKTSSGDKVEVLDFHSGEPIAGYDISQLGEQLIGVPESVFEKTFWFQQNSVSFTGKDEVLTGRLMNLLESGTEELSVSRVLEDLESKRKEIKAKDGRGNPGELDRLWKLREEKMQDRYRILSERSQREGEERKLKEATDTLNQLRGEETSLRELQEQKNQLIGLDSQRKKWKEAMRLKRLSEEISSQEKYQLYTDLTEEKVQKAESLEKEIEVLDQISSIEYDIEKEDKLILGFSHMEKRMIILFVLGIVFVASALVFSVVRALMWPILTGAFGSFGVLCLLFSFWKIQSVKKSLQQANERKKIFQDEAKATSLKHEHSLKEYREILNLFSCRDAKELRDGFLYFQKAKIEAEGYFRTYQSMVEGDEWMTPSKMEEVERFLSDKSQVLNVDADEQLLKKRASQMEVLAIIKEAEGKLSYVYHEQGTVADIETELIQLNQKIQELEKRLRGIELATDVFRQVAENRKFDFTPKVNEKVNDYLDILTNGRYRDARVSKEYQLRILPDETGIYQAEFFSTGTYEQIYFALRLALASLLGDGQEPLFMDDFLAFYDDERAMLAMNLLKELSNNRQIFLFSCHLREVENAEKLGISIQYLEEE